MFGAVLQFFSGTYFGNTLEQYSLFFATIIAFVLLGKMANYVLLNHVKRLAAKTRSEMDDVMIEAVSAPLAFFSLVLGVYIGLNTFLTLEASLKQTASNVLGLLFILDLAWFLVKIVDGFVIHFLVPLTKRTRSRMDDQLIPIISKGLKAAVIVMAGIVILDNFGYDITAIIAGLGIGGLAVAFAAQQTIADAFGGVNIFVSKPFFVGDKIEVEGISGKVEQIGIRHTHIRDFEGRLNIISNSKISSAIVKNVTSEPGRRIRMNLGLTYSTSVEKTKK
ncbi:MAG: mechanosensitive ion channel family protein, partial [Candidatus Diapherotrites archaeon]|nr:mechanosensitive ion channel family protein [Candidatus Diapherotrites archaeon]